MMNKRNLNIERLLGKIENDFNPDNSDWIPRCGAWIIDALSQIKCLPKERKKRKITIESRIGRFPCDIDPYSLKIYDEHNCEILEAKQIECCGRKTNYTSQQIGVSRVSDDETQKVIVADIINPTGRNYILIGNDKIELNFNANYVIVDSLEIVQYYSEYYNCYLPYIFDDGILLEALAWYCMLKMLHRGYKHPVFSLNGHESINPYSQWKILKVQAAASVKIAMRKQTGNDGWNNFFYNSTFLPRNT